MDEFYVLLNEKVSFCRFCPFQIKPKKDQKDLREKGLIYWGP